MPEWLKALLVIGGAALAGVVIAAVLDELTETPAEKRRRELDRTRLNLPAGRIALPGWFRDEISRAHNWRCAYCGARTTRASRHIDHATALARGGNNEPRNLVNACIPCNLMKGTTSAAAYRARLRAYV